MQWGQTGQPANAETSQTGAFHVPPFSEAIQSSPL